MNHFAMLLSFRVFSWERRARGLGGWEESPRTKNHHHQNLPSSRTTTTKNFLKRIVRDLFPLIFRRTILISFHPPIFFHFHFHQTFHLHNFHHAPACYHTPIELQTCCAGGVWEAKVSNGHDAKAGAWWAKELWMAGNRHER